MQELEGQQQIKLSKGLTIQPLKGWKDHLRVENVDANSITIYDSRYNRTHQATRTKPLSIGRADGSDVYYPEAAHISRKHGTIKYSNTDGTFIYLHNGKNPCFVDPPNAEESISVQEQDGTDFMDSNTKETHILHDGMKLQFHQHLSSFTVHIKGDQLTLKRDDTTHSRCQEDYLATKETPVFLGRKTLAHTDISELHAMVNWDKAANEWVMEKVGKYPVAVSFASNFKIEQAKINQKLHFSPEQAAQKLQEIKDFKKELEGEITNARQVQDFEMNSVMNPYCMGGRTEDSQRGYEIWLKAFGILYESELSDQEKKSIQKATMQVHELGENRKAIRDIEIESKIPKYHQNAAENFPYADQINAMVNKKYQQFIRSAEAFLPSGFRGHHTVVRFFNENSKFKLTIYNAGAETEADPKHPLEYNQVMVAQTRWIKDADDVKPLMKLLIEKKMRSPGYDNGQFDPDGYSNVLNEIEARLEPFMHKKNEYRIGTPQSKGNCTTRSTREALRDALGEALFNHVHKHISDPNLCDIDDITQALDDRARRLEEMLEKSPPSAPPPSGYAANLTIHVNTLEAPHRA